MLYRPYICPLLERLAYLPAFADAASWRYLKGQFGWTVAHWEVETAVSWYGCLLGCTPASQLRHIAKGCMTLEVGADRQRDRLNPFSCINPNCSPTKCHAQRHAKLG